MSKKPPEFRVSNPFELKLCKGNGAPSAVGGRAGPEQKKPGCFCLSEKNLIYKENFHNEFANLKRSVSANSGNLN